MKLSEAIRAGAKLRSQCYGSAFTTDFDAGTVCGSCALGAAYEATVIDMHGGMELGDYLVNTPYIIEDLSGDYPELQKLMDETGHTLADLIWHMNDGQETEMRRHSREEIADIVESWGF
jgi:hypothetical protein